MLDALSEEEARAFEAHLHDCPTCRAEVAELRLVADVLPLAVEPVEPPASLRSRILTQARAEEPSARLAIVPPEPSERTPVRRRLRLRRPMAWAGAVAAALIIGLGAWNISLQQQVHTHSTASAITNALAHGAQAWPVTGTNAAPAATGTLIQPKHGANAIFVVSGLPASPPNKVYQIWLVRGTRPTSGGTFSVSSAGPQVVSLLQSATGYQVTAVTLEPGPRGSRAPTGKPVVVGKLGA